MQVKPLMLAIASTVSAQATSIGVGDAAKYIDRSCSERAERLADSWTIGRAEAITALARVASECAFAGWDGANAWAIDPRSVELARRVISGLPCEVESPSVGVDPDGMVTLEWHRSPRRTLSVSVGPDGMVYYAARIGDERIHGRQPSPGELSPCLFDLVKRVVGR